MLNRLWKGCVGLALLEAFCQMKFSGEHGPRRLWGTVWGLCLRQGSSPCSCCSGRDLKEKRQKEGKKGCSLPFPAPKLRGEREVPALRCRT